MVVETAKLEVVTLAGQSVTDGAQEVTVTTVVAYIVLVVKDSVGALERDVVVSMTLVTGASVVVESDLVTGTMVVETGKLEVVSLAGQSVTDAAQEVTVKILAEKTVLVEKETESVVVVVGEAPAGEETKEVPVSVAVSSSEHTSVPTASALEVDVIGRLAAEEPVLPEPLPSEDSATPDDAAGELTAEVKVPLPQECDRVWLCGR